jgi:hypothetical protein
VSESLLGISDRERRSYILVIVDRDTIELEGPRSVAREFLLGCYEFGDIGVFVRSILFARSIPICHKRSNQVAVTKGVY